MASSPKNARVILLKPDHAQQQRQQAPLGRLFEQNRGRLQAYVQRMLPADTQAEDIIQEVFTKLIQRDSHADLDNPTAYLMMMAKNTVIDHLRKRKQQQSFTEQHIEENSNKEKTELHHHEMIIAIEEALRALPERCREVFILSRYQGLKSSEIARKLNISPRMVQKHMLKAFNHFQKHLV